MGVIGTCCEVRCPCIPCGVFHRFPCSVLNVALRFISSTNLVTLFMVFLLSPLLGTLLTSSGMLPVEVFNVVTRVGTCFTYPHSLQACRQYLTASCGSTCCTLSTADWHAAPVLVVNPSAGTASSAAGLSGCMISTAPRRQPAAHAQQTPPRLSLRSDLRHTPSTAIDGSNCSRQPCNRSPGQQGSHQEQPRSTSCPLGEAPRRFLHGRDPHPCHHVELRKGFNMVTAVVRSQLPWTAPLECASNRCSREPCQAGAFAFSPTLRLRLRWQPQLQSHQRSPGARRRTWAWPCAQKKEGEFRRARPPAAAARPDAPCVQLCGGLYADAVQAVHTGLQVVYASTHNGQQERRRQRQWADSRLFQHWG